MADPLCDRAEGRTVRALNRTSGTVVCSYLEQATGLAAQARGLIGRRSLGLQHGMLFRGRRHEPFMWFHTMFMRFPIDIVFLDCEGRVLRINSELNPWRCSSMVWGARLVLELAAQAAARSGTLVGHSIGFEPLTGSQREPSLSGAMAGDNDH